MLPSSQLLLPRHVAAAAMPAPMRAQCSSISSSCAAIPPRPRLAERRQRGPPRGRAMSLSKRSRPTTTTTTLSVFASSASRPAPPSPSKAALLVAQGRAKYAAGDRMGALALFESALKQSPSAPEAAAASWNATVVHCSFGDVELAQITLRDALAAGLDFDAALAAEGRRVTGARVDEVAAAVAENTSASFTDAGAEDPAAAAAAALRLPFAGSPQVASQLRKFARAFARASSSSSSSSSSAAPLYSSSSSSSSPSSSSPISVDGIDASPAAIAKRVAVLLAVLLGLGVGLYLYGLQYLYPTS